MSREDMSGKRQPFQMRALTSLMMAISFLIVSFSGLVLFFAPNGREARQQGWELLSLSKWEWINIHIVFSYLCVLTAVFHIWFNRKPLIGYLKQKASKACDGIRWEWLAVVVICIGLFWATSERAAPASYLLDWHDSIKF